MNQEKQQEMKVNKMSVINEWPESQVCIGCRHAIFILEGSSRYECKKECVSASLCCDKNREEATQKEWEAKFE